MNSFRSCPARRPLPRIREAGTFPLPPATYRRTLRRILIENIAHAATVAAITGRPMRGTPAGMRTLTGRSAPRVGLRAAMLILITGSPYVRNDPARLARCRAILRGETVAPFDHGVPRAYPRPGGRPAFLSAGIDPARCDCPDGGTGRDSRCGRCGLRFTAPPMKRSDPAYVSAFARRSCTGCGRAFTPVHFSVDTCGHCDDD